MKFMRSCLVQIAYQHPFPDRPFNQAFKVLGDNQVLCFHGSVLEEWGELFQGFLRNKGGEKGPEGGDYMMTRDSVIWMASSRAVSVFFPDHVPAEFIDIDEVVFEIQYVRKVESAHDTLTRQRRLFEDHALCDLPSRTLQVALPAAYTSMDCARCGKRGRRKYSLNASICVKPVALRRSGM